MSKSKILVFLCLIAVFWTLRLWYINQKLKGEAKVVFCDVGQGDAILISWYDWQLLIDGGPDNAVLRCLNEELPPFDRTIELVILSHPDSDHFVGLTGVLRLYRVKRVWLSNLAKNADDWFQFYDALMFAHERFGTMIEFPTLEERWCVNEMLCGQIVAKSELEMGENIFMTRKSKFEIVSLINKFVPISYDYNNGSIAVNLSIANNSFLFTGDAEGDEELAMIRSGLLGDVDVLKVGHHGSKSSSSPEFLSMLKPETSVISCGQNNSYGHPHEQTIVNLEAVGAEVLRTDKLGKIRWLKSSNADWHWEWEKD